MTNKIENVVIDIGLFRFIIFEVGTGRLIEQHQVEVVQSYPREG
jgi:hypothetical protein